MPVEVGISQIIERKRIKKVLKWKVKFKKLDGYDKSDRSDKNLVGRNGNILKCFKCDSARHLTQSTHIEPTNTSHGWIKDGSKQSQENFRWRNT